MSRYGRLTLSFAVLALVGCGADEPASCKVLCTQDVDCPTGQTCGDLGLCTTGEACPCTEGQFLGCLEGSARFCNAGGAGVFTETCGDGGCNAEAGRCNQCVPDEAKCSSDQASVEQCGADGLPLGTEACMLGCEPRDAAAATPISDHCRYVAPEYLSDEAASICDQRASVPTLTVSAGEYDTAVDTLCTGGVLTQTSGPAICVLRAETITISGIVRVTGPRVIAFVADDELTVTGTLDVSADGGANGPGGGYTLSGAKAGAGLGGGGAGFYRMGANGGSTTGSGDGGAGGAQLTPTPQTTGFIGGPRPTLPTNSQSLNGHPSSGGGGGGALLVACRGTVAISGTIDANGGGGGPGRDTVMVANSTSFVGGAGGGAGGYVTIQGAGVEITGSLFSNGGGGGGSCGTDECVGNPGQDGQRSTSGALGGAVADGGAPGGVGGTSGGPYPGFGTASAGGGGGGAAGYLEVYTPSTVSATVTPAVQSPAIVAKQTLVTR